jgi:hypothetical protein
VRYACRLPEYNRFIVLHRATDAAYFEHITVAELMRLLRDLAMPVEVGVLDAA